MKEFFTPKEAHAQLQKLVADDEFASKYPAIIEYLTEADDILPISFFVTAKEKMIAKLAGSLVGDMREVDRHIRANQKIVAIKAYRQIFGVGLKEAKDGVERRMAQLTLTET